MSVMVVTYVHNSKSSISVGNMKNKYLEFRIDIYIYIFFFSLLIFKAFLGS